MDEHTFDLLKSRFDKIESRIDLFEEKFGNKLDELMKWKWSVYGMTLIIGGAAGLFVSIILAFIERR